MPIIFAQSFIVVPGTAAAFMDLGPLSVLAEIFQPQTMTYYVTYGFLILFFTYFYTAIIFNPIDLAENLKKQGAFIPGVKPGARTAEYIDRVLTRVTLPARSTWRSSRSLPSSSSTCSTSRRSFSVVPAF